MRLPTMHHNRWQFFLLPKMVDCIVLFVTLFLRVQGSFSRLPAELVQSVRFENNPLQLVHIRMGYFQCPQQAEQFVGV